MKTAEVESITVRWLDALLGFVQRKMNESFFNAGIRRLSSWGLLCIYVAALLGFLVALVSAIRTDSLNTMALGLVWVLINVILHYVAAKFLPVTQSIVANTPSKLSCEALPRCVGLLACLAGVVILCLGIAISIQLKALWPCFVALGLLIASEYKAAAALNPQLLSITFDSFNSAGQEAIGVLSLIMKITLRLVPILFGSGLLLGTLYGLIRAFGLFGENAAEAKAALMGLAPILLTFQALPLIGFLVFILYYLTVDVMSAILKVPGKLDELKK